MPITESYANFLQRLAHEESRGRYHINSPSGTYLGKYQMGPGALQDAGYKDSSGNWTGKNGIFTDDDYRKNKNNAQEDAVREYHEKVWGYIQAAGLEKYEGRVINGTRITKHGMIGAYHLKGIGEKGITLKDDQGLRQYLESGGKTDPVDGNNTPVSSYMERLAGEGNINIPRPVRKPGTENLTDEEIILEELTIEKLLRKMEDEETLEKLIDEEEERIKGENSLETETITVTVEK